MNALPFGSSVLGLFAALFLAVPTSVSSFLLPEAHCFSVLPWSCYSLVSTAVSSRDLLHHYRSFLNFPPFSGSYSFAFNASSRNFDLSSCPIVASDSCRECLPFARPKAILDGLLLITLTSLTILSKANCHRFPYP